MFNSHTYKVGSFYTCVEFEHCNFYDVFVEIIKGFLDRVCVYVDMLCCFLCRSSQCNDWQLSCVDERSCYQMVCFTISICGVHTIMSFSIL